MQTSQDAIILLENFMAQTIQSLITFRVKREATFTAFYIATLQYLSEQYQRDAIGYDVSIKQSGKKGMGMYIIGKVVLTINDEVVEVPVKLKMRGWKESKAILDIKNKTVVEPTVSVEDIVA